MKRTETIESMKSHIHDLYNSLKNRKKQTSEILDITDVLLQVYKNIDTCKNPEVLINRLINYIRFVSLKGKLSYLPNEDKIINELAEFSKKVGLNGLYRADVSDKSQFYNYNEDTIYRK